MLVTNFCGFILIIYFNIFNYLNYTIIIKLNYISVHRILTPKAKTSDPRTVKKGKAPPSRTGETRVWRSLVTRRKPYLPLKSGLMTIFLSTLTPSVVCPFSSIICACHSPNNISSFLSYLIIPSSLNSFICSFLFLNRVCSKVTGAGNENGRSWKRILLRCSKLEVQFTESGPL